MSAPAGSTRLHAVASHTIVADARLRRLLLGLWALTAVLNIGLFAWATPGYFRDVQAGCLCDDTYIDRQGGHIVLLPFPGGALAGLVKSGDILTAVDGRPVPAEARIDEAIALTDGGPAGSRVTLTVRTSGEPPRDVTLQRSASFAILEPGLALGLQSGGAATLAAGLDILFFSGFVVVGLIIVWRRSDDWMALWTSGVLIAYGLTQTEAASMQVFGNPQFPGGSQYSVLLGGVSVLLLLLFPDGRLRPRWLLLAAAASISWNALDRFGPAGLLPDVAIQVVYFVMTLTTLATVAFRYRRYFDATSRQQTKWLLTCIAAALLINQLYQVGSAWLFTNNYPVYRVFIAVGQPLADVSPLLIPLGTAFAILHYQLWDIDQTINRSLVTVILAALLGALFVGLFAAANEALRAALGNGQAPLAAAAAAGLTALCFNPIHHVVRGFVDRRIYRFRFDLSELRQGQEPARVSRPGALTGRTLGEYELLGVLGRGGMGEVYQARGAGRQAAIKILPEALAGQPDFIRRFEREARTLAACDHPNIVRLYGAGQSDGIYYIAQEYIEGQDLADRLRQQGPAALAEVRPLLGEFAQALDYAHARGLVHRDIKPSNIMLRRLGPRVVLMDFGLAKMVTDQTALTGTNAVGTIGYMAPEQIMAARNVDRRADIYALGAVLYELLTGQLPFQGDPARILFAHLQQPPPDARAARPEIPEPAAAAIMRAMAKNPDERFQSAGEFAAALG